MAIIRCPQCKWGMNEKAWICRNCGYLRTQRPASAASGPVSSSLTAEDGPASRFRQWAALPQQERDNIGFTLWLVILSIVAGGLCWYTA